jgi:hypothetical protein
MGFNSGLKGLSRVMLQAIYDHERDLVVWKTWRTFTRFKGLWDFTPFPSHFIL